MRAILNNKENNKKENHKKEDNKKVLILGATGAMSVYLIPKLLENGYSVDGIALDEVQSDNPKLRYIKHDAFDLEFLTKLLENKYDAIVDFMIYNSIEKFQKYYKLYLDNTQHYIYLSTYRVYADDSPLHEGAKRLLDIERPDDFVTENEYSIYKAEEENLLNECGYTNYSIIRPAITYSKRRFQLTIMEANVWLYRMLMGKTVVLPESAMDKQATMSWAGDVANMISGIILNPKAMTETYNVSTSEHMTWREVAEIYTEIGGLKYVTTDDESFIQIIAGGSVYAKQQLLYDRCYNRIVDNSKILNLCGMKQSDLMPLKEGLKKELKNITKDNLLQTIGCYKEANDRMDAYLEKL